MQFFQGLSDIVANIVLLFSVHTDFSSQWITYFFILLVFIGFIDIFSGKNHESEYGEIKLNFIKFLPKLFPTAIDLLIIVTCGIISLRGLMIPTIIGVSQYNDNYLFYSINVPSNWTKTYDKPSGVLDQYITTGNVTFRSEDSKDYIFIGALGDYDGTVFTSENKDIFSKYPVDTIYRHKISTFGDELVGLVYKNGKKILVAGKSDGALIRYIFSTLN